MSSLISFPPRRAPAGSKKASKPLVTVVPAQRPRAVEAGAMLTLGTQAPAVAVAVRKKRVPKGVVLDGGPAARADTNVDPEVLVKAHRAKLAERTASALEAELEAARSELADCLDRHGKCKRWRRIDAEGWSAKIVDLQERITHVKLGLHLVEFDAKARPFLQRWKELGETQHGFSSTTGKTGRVQYVRGQQQATIDPALAVATAQGRTDVIAVPKVDPRAELTETLRVEVLGEAPRVVQTRGDVCDDCGVAMQYIANGSRLGCTICAKTREHRGVAGAGGGGEGEGSAMNAHQKNRFLGSMEMAQGKNCGDPPSHMVVVVGKQAYRAPATQWMQRLKEVTPLLMAEADAHGPFSQCDAATAIARLRPVIPDIEDILRSITGVRVRTQLAAISKQAFDWLPHSLEAHARAVAAAAVAAAGQAAAQAAQGAPSSASMIVPVIRPHPPAERYAESVRKQYDGAPKLAAALSGVAPLQMRPDLEDRQRRLFLAAVAVYEKMRTGKSNTWPGGHLPFIRDNLVMEGWDEYAVLFSQRPSDSTTDKAAANYAALRKAACAELDWQYLAWGEPRPPILVSNLATGTGEPLVLPAYMCDDPPANPVDKAAAAKARAAQAAAKRAAAKRTATEVMASAVESALTPAVAIL